MDFWRRVEDINDRQKVVYKCALGVYRNDRTTSVLFRYWTEDRPLLRCQWPQSPLFFLFEFIREVKIHKNGKYLKCFLVLDICFESRNKRWILILFSWRSQKLDRFLLPMYLLIYLCSHKLKLDWFMDLYIYLYIFYNLVLHLFKLFFCRWIYVFFSAADIAPWGETPQKNETRFLRTKQWIQFLQVVQLFYVKNPKIIEYVKS